MSDRHIQAAREGGFRVLVEAKALPVPTDEELAAAFEGAVRAWLDSAGGTELTAGYMDSAAPYIAHAKDRAAFRALAEAIRAAVEEQGR